MMNYSFLPKNYYRMPTHFGPSLGPRQGLDGRRYACIDSPNATAYKATFCAEKEELEKLLPPDFSLRAPYTVTFEFNYCTNIEWLAGRGYNTFGVSIPATYNGTADTVHGDLLLVLWENMADPIITGREDLGFSKIYCELPEAQTIGNDVICRASWDGFEFASLRLKGLCEIDIEEKAADVEEAEPSEGLLHYKYMPKTGCPGEADAEYAVLTPADWPNMKLEHARQAETATLVINRGTWEQLPTLVHIVSCLSELTLGECIQAKMTKSRGAKDLSDQRILR